MSCSAVPKLLYKKKLLDIISTNIVNPFQYKLASCSHSKPRIFGLPFCSAYPSFISSWAYTNCAHPMVQPVECIYAVCTSVFQLFFCLLFQQLGLINRSHRMLHVTLQKRHGFNYENISHGEILFRHGNLMHLKSCSRTMLLLALRVVHDVLVWRSLC